MKKQQKRFTLSSSKGFTLIELLVVIAIIGILATIVMVSLNTARSKAADASVKANLKAVMTQAELVYDTASPNSYAGVCADTIVVKAIAAAGAQTTGAITVCNNSATAWAASAGVLKSAGGYWCVDSVANNKTEVATLPAATYVCP